MNKHQKNLFANGASFFGFTISHMYKCSIPYIYISNTQQLCKNKIVLQLLLQYVNNILTLYLHCGII